MIKKVLHYHDLDGNPKSGEFWFNISKAELAKLILVKGEGFDETLIRIVESKNGKEIIDTFEEVIELSYGVRGDDGESFHKSPELFAKFKATDAYSELFMELITGDGGAAFVRGIMPLELAEKLPKEIPTQARVTHLPTPPDYSSMTREELEEAMRQMTQKPSTGGGQ